VEIFGVVAAPETGLAIRVYHRELKGELVPDELGKLVAQKLLAAGAGPLLEATSGVPR
jgi:hypothetical protein